MRNFLCVKKLTIEKIKYHNFVIKLTKKKIFFFIILSKLLKRDFNNN